MAVASPLLFRLPEHTYVGAFVYAALTASIATALVLEYRLADPFDARARDLLPLEEEEQAGRPPRLLRTSAVAFIATLLTLVLLYRLFAAGGGMLSPPRA